ncbi:MAG: hypothetical protein KGO99_05515 [Actinomycetales bacterium]|nr:hypothetical protein [Actinomycetales bacterium]
MAIIQAIVLPTLPDSNFLPGSKKVKPNMTTPVPTMMTVRVARLLSPDW